VHKERLESGLDVQNTPEKNSYQRYLDLGGIINEDDYDSALKRAGGATKISEVTIMQAENIARFSGIELRDIDGTIDPRVTLYGILRNDARPEGVKYHHDQMSDQQIFVEALRMFGNTESADKVIKAHPNISFKYQREDIKKK
jgi:hypothetical protein